MVTDFVRRVGVEPADDMPNYGGHSGQFMFGADGRLGRDGFPQAEITLEK